MNLRFYHDPETDQPHIYDHGVNEDDVEDVLRDPVEDARSRRGSRIAIGQTRHGRYLKVVYVPDEIGDGIFVLRRMIWSAARCWHSGAECARGNDEQVDKIKQEKSIPKRMG